MADVPWSESSNTEWWDLTRESKTDQSLKSGVSKSDLIARATGKLQEEWPDPPQGDLCIASIGATWPTIGSLTPWPDCYDGPQAATGSANVTKARYRFGVPNNFSTTEAPRSTYLVQWDEVFFPTGYDAEIDDPEVTPPDPLPDGWQHPQIADPDAPQPSLVASREWTWNGSMSNPWSEWFEIEIPAATGETRVVNVLVKCYQSARLGVKPTAHGNTYPLPE